MAKRTKGVKARSVTFRVPEPTYDVLLRVANERGLDVTAVLNLIISDAVPGLLEWLAKRPVTVSFDFDPDVPPAVREALLRDVAEEVRRRGGRLTIGRPPTGQEGGDDAE